MRLPVPRPVPLTSARASDSQPALAGRGTRAAPSRIDHCCAWAVEAFSLQPGTPQPDAASPWPRHGPPARRRVGASTLNPTGTGGDPGRSGQAARPQPLPSRTTPGQAARDRRSPPPRWLGRACAGPCRQYVEVSPGCAAVRNLWMTLRATSSLWTTRFGKAAEGSPLNGGAEPRVRAWWETYATWSDPTVSAPWWETYANQAQTRPFPRGQGNVRQPGHRPDRFRAPGGKRTRGNRPSGLEMIEHCNLILIKSNRLARHGHQTRERGARFLLPGGPFHCVRIGVERTAR